MLRSVLSSAWELAETLPVVERERNDIYKGQIDGLHKARTLKNIDVHASVNSFNLTSVECSTLLLEALRLQFGTEVCRPTNLPT